MELLSVACSLLSCFGNAGKDYESKTFHGLIIRRNYEFDKMVISSLLSMYCKCGCLDPAEKLFDGPCEWETNSWNCIVAGYGKSIHCHVIKSGMDENTSVINSLVGMYGKLENLATARKIFFTVDRDIVTWNTLMSAYTHNRLSSEALAFFYEMILADLKPSSVTLVIALSACSHLAALDHGKRLHAYIKDMWLECDLSVANALVDMYVKCGQLQTSRVVFDSVSQRDVVFWNVMVSGYGIHGDAKSAVDIFQQLETSDVRPNAASFLAVLSACTHAGLVEEGKDLFCRMRDYSVVPTLRHYAFMVDLLGHSGYLEDAEAMVQSMSLPPDGAMWGALLGACKIYNNVEVGERVARLAIDSGPGNDRYYIMLSNLYSSVGKWKEAEEVRGIMKNKRVRKRSGWTVGVHSVLNDKKWCKAKMLTRYNISVVSEKVIRDPRYVAYLKFQETPQPVENPTLWICDGNAINSTAVKSLYFVNLKMIIVTSEDVSEEDK
ncbi:hypothetical protein IFM89_025262 [Coptis chinensis]|uniref:Pentatricopeptide repeat-containing protein n=1 Tax=Coptis chinensis TaxID=261450 RepID=A0A835LZL4_9MAGN|nr:hypothetical protein IFM89_025262 [Coptis chinensis]